MTRNNIVMWSSLYKNLLDKCLEPFYKSYGDLKTVYYSGWEIIPHIDHPTAEKETHDWTRTPLFT